MTEALPEYKVYALRYATRDARRGEHFVGGDPHDAPMPMDYYVWAAVSPERTFIIDTGFTAETAARRARKFLRDPIAALNLLGIDPDAVNDVILTHLHYDHVGNFHRFAKAQFHLQEPEIHFATGRHMRHHAMSHGFELDDILGVVKLNYAQRVRFYNGEAQLAPGLSVHPAPGHSAGLQFVRVHTKRGFVVLASDASHFYENMDSARPFPALLSLPDTIDGYDKLRAVAPSPDHIVPGHDPLVMRLYKAPSAELEGIAVRLDEPPLRRND
jgi:glyoxylase-like metal-dependent hydrolase (beta-lactamase superfamily II)